MEHAAVAAAVFTGGARGDLTRGTARQLMPRDHNQDRAFAAAAHHRPNTSASASTPGSRSPTAIHIAPGNARPARTRTGCRASTAQRHGPRGPRSGTPGCRRTRAERTPSTRARLDATIRGVRGDCCDHRLKPPDPSMIAPRFSRSMQADPEAQVRSASNMIEVHARCTLRCHRLRAEGKPGQEAARGTGPR
jgi:hypothetical protein